MACELGHHGRGDLAVVPGKLASFALGRDSLWNAQDMMWTNNVIVGSPPFQMQCQLLTIVGGAPGAADEQADTLAQG